MGFHWSLSDYKSLHVSRTLLSTLVDFSKAVVWMVSTHPLISKSSIPFINPFVTVPRAFITIGIIVTFMFHGIFNSLAKSRNLCLFLIFFQFHSVVSRDSKVHNSANSLFLMIVIRFVRLVKIWWWVCISKSKRSLCVSFNRTYSGLYIYDLFVWSNFNSL